MSDLRLTLDGARVALTPIRSLGQQRFARYRAIVRSSGGIPHPTQWRDYCLPVSLPDMYTALVGAGFGLEIGPEITAAMRETAHALEQAQAQDCDPRLYAYQREGVGYLRARRKAMLADDMGLGKTAQILTAAHGGSPMLVICPAIAKGVWRSESAIWTPERRVYVLNGRGSFRWPRVGELIVANYDILPPPGAMLPTPQPGTVLVGDEAHYCKGGKTLRARAMNQLVRMVLKAPGGRAWGATGTPLANWPPDLWRTLTTFGLAEPAFGTWPRFVELFGGAKDRWGRWSWTGPHASVPAILARVMLRRTKAQVFPQMPKKTYSLVRVPISDPDSAEIERLLRLAGIRVDQITPEMLGRILRSSPMMAARKLLAASKTKHALAWVEEAEDAGEPVVVYSAHRSPVLAFKDRAGWAIIVGEVPTEERARIAERFQRGELKGIAATIDAGGVAITLTRACMALFVDLEWTPAANSQAEDRLLRIGQTRPVTIYRLIAEHPIDERVESLLRQKDATLQKSVEAVTATSDSVTAQRLNDLADQIDLAFL